MSAFPLAGEVVATKFSLSLDWSDPIHWDDDEVASCRDCGTPTHSRDVQGRPIHQSCAARLVAEQVGPRGGEVVDERFPTPAQQLAPHEHTEVTR
jgi:hypothetical protein